MSIFLQRMLSKYKHNWFLKKCINSGSVSNIIYITSLYLNKQRLVDYIQYDYNSNSVLIQIVLYYNPL